MNQTDYRPKNLGNLRNRWMLSIVSLVVTFFGFAATTIASVQSIWAVNDGEKIERDDLKNPNKGSNSAWDGHKIKIFGARNEIIAFQIVVEADKDGINKLLVALPELRQSDGPAKITYLAPQLDPTIYVQRPIQIFSLNYMNVETPSHAEWVYKPGSPAAPKDPTGWKPVQLVPENARTGRGGFPLSVPAGSNQAVWVEIYTNRNLPAGRYNGTVTVNADGEKHSLPIELELFDFTLPDQNSMQAMVYYESLQPKLYQGRDLDAEYHRFAHRQRIELVHDYDRAKVEAVRSRFDGTDFSRARGYEGPGENVGNQIIPRTFYGPGKLFDERSSAWGEADSWVTFLRENFPNALTFLYLPDEPGPSRYKYIRQLADNVHTNPGPGKALPTFVTKHYVKDLDGAIDIWDTGPLGYDIKRADEERRRGHKYWIYNGGRPAAGAIVIDAPATDARATIWACFKHGVDNYFYWEGVHWQHNRQKVGERKQNVWANPITFDNRGQPNKPLEDQGYINGDGVLIYPGEDKLHPQEDRGIAGPISTVQLANLRRGLQDHQYLTLARKLKLDSLVDELLQSVVPHVFSDSGPAIGFSEAGNDYERARYKLAQAIAKQSTK
ncbi:MAG TPA: glycoside hydrolase domain-containing protein [Pyrinomonadaceae bacterium]|nr:glycoside hydrolase domain-containing protein [Pyrinomonadaceae bacterium]